MTQDNFRLVESITVNAAPAASLAGQKFELGMRNIITGPNGSGKTILARLIASVAHPDHVAEMSHSRNVDIEVRWFDPHTHDVATVGRSGDVTHVLDGRRVPYVARPYKTTMLDGDDTRFLGNLVGLAHMFDLSSSAMKGTLSMLAESSRLVKEVIINGTDIDWVLDDHGRTARWTRGQCVSTHVSSSILLELAGFHARHHARVEPTLLILDSVFWPFSLNDQIAALERLHEVAGHAQVAAIGQSTLAAQVSPEWPVTALDHHESNVYAAGCPIDFEIETTTAPPPAFDPE